jgi:DNA-binding beta-propeller fold protein YncE
MRTGATGHDVMIGPGGYAPVVDSRHGLVFLLVETFNTVPSVHDVVVVSSDLRTFLHTIPVGQQPYTEVLDLQHQRLLVANGNGNSISIIDLRALKPGAFPPNCFEVRLGQTPIC